ncbi:MAG: SDR family oxidoreductase [Geobacter sp.]|nr:SDR family oxidoreductase [Geobacter sp.]
MKENNDRGTVLVTGATSGIGYALSRRFAADGFSLVMVARDARRLEEISEEFRRNYSVETHWIVKDLAAPEAAQEIFDESRSNKIHVDILVNNAGFNEHGSFVETDHRQELRMIQVHIAALTSLTKLFLPAMVQRKQGGILNVGSTGSFAPVPLDAVYCASKAYILSFTEALADELRGSGVKVTALCPGATETQFASRANMEGTRIFQGRLMDAETVAEAGYRALLRGNTRIVPGFANKATIASLRFLPRDMVARIGRWMMSQKPGYSA